VLADVADLLRCPVCEGGVAIDDAALRCPAGHAFDIARQGYVNLVPGRADTPEMVEARDAFLRAGHFRPLAVAIGDAVELHARPGPIVDLGAGTGHYLAHALDVLAGAFGIAIDASPAALRRAARCHDRAGAVGADAWKTLPLRDGIATIALSVFAPRNASEMRRILAPSGVLVAVTPTTRHLHELVGPLGLLSVPGDKEDRLDAQLAGHFSLTERRTIEHAMFLTRDECAQLVRMGPSAWHIDERTTSERLAALPDPLTVTASTTLSLFRVS
jgi:23S rRNA (guanine745-N1)-methyltransferase